MPGSKSRQNSEGICTPSPLSARTSSAGLSWVHWASSCQLLPQGPLLFHWHFGLSNQKSRFMDWALKFALGTTETCKTVYPIKKSSLDEAKISSWLFLEDLRGCFGSHTGILERCWNFSRLFSVVWDMDSLYRPDWAGTQRSTCLLHVPPCLAERLEF